MGAIARFFGLGTEVRSGSVGSAGGDSPLLGVVPPTRAVLPAVAARDALRVSVVSRAVDEINTMIAGLDLYAYDRHGKRMAQAPDILRTPCLEMDREELIQQSVNDFLLFGEFFWLLNRLPTGQVINVRPLPPDSVTVVMDPMTGRRDYAWQGQLPKSRIVHKRHTTLSHEARGRGPVQAAQQELRLALALAYYQEQWFDGRPPEMVLTTDQPLSGPMREQIAADWKAFLADPTNRTAILSAGVSLDSMLLKPVEAQMIEVMDALDRKLARIFGVGAQDMLVPLRGESRTYVNLETTNLDFLTRTLQKPLNALERAFTEVLPGRLDTARFDERGLLRLDSKTQAEIDQLHVTTGLRSEDEIRARDGLAPLPAPKLPTTTVRPPAKPAPAEQGAQ